MRMVMFQQNFTYRSRWQSRGENLVIWATAEPLCCILNPTEDCVSVILQLKKRKNMLMLAYNGFIVTLSELNIFYR